VSARRTASAASADTSRRSHTCHDTRRSGSKPRGAERSSNSRHVGVQRGSAGSDDDEGGAWASDAPLQVCLPHSGVALTGEQWVAPPERHRAAGHRCMQQVRTNATVGGSGGVQPLHVLALPPALDEPAGELQAACIEPAGEIGSACAQMGTQSHQTCAVVTRLCHACDVAG
jgi:hypothetical protein